MDRGLARIIHVQGIHSKWDVLVLIPIPTVQKTISILETKANGGHTYPPTTESLHHLDCLLIGKASGFHDTVLRIESECEWETIHHQPTVSIDHQEM